MSMLTYTQIGKNQTQLYISVQYMYLLNQEQLSEQNEK